MGQWPIPGVLASSQLTTTQGPAALPCCPGRFTPVGSFPAGISYSLVVCSPFLLPPVGVVAGAFYGV